MPRIEQMYAFIAEDRGPGDEGVTAFKGPLGWMPMVAADEARVESLREVAREMARAGKRIKLVRFSVREEVEVFKPTPAPRPS